jgi:hypothetical protein
MGHSRVISAEPARHSTPQLPLSRAGPLPCNSNSTAEPAAVQQQSRACCFCQDHHVSRARTHVRTPGPASGMTGRTRTSPATHKHTACPAKRQHSSPRPHASAAQHSTAPAPAPAPSFAAASQHQQCVPKFPSPWARGTPALSLPCGGRQGVAGSSLGYSSGFVRVSAAQSDGAAGQPA